MDPGQASGSVLDPQGWNAYAHGRNNPLRYVDLDGLLYLVCRLRGPKGCSMVQDADWRNAMDNPGWGYAIQGDESGGRVLRWSEGQWQADASYEHLGSLEKTVGDAAAGAEAGIKFFAKEMALGAAGSAVAGTVRWGTEAAIAALELKGIRDAYRIGALTIHGFEQAVLRSVTPAQALEAIRSARVTGQVIRGMGRYGPQLRYRGANGITVIVALTGRNAGKIVTVFR